MKNNYLLSRQNIFAKGIFLCVLFMSFVSVSAENLLVSYIFEDETFDPAIGGGAKITATPIANSSPANLSFEIFSEIDELTEAVLNRCIHDHGQGLERINAVTESEALISPLTNNRSDFLTFTVTPNTAYTLKLDSLTFDIQARNGKQSGSNLRYRAGLYSSKTGFSFTSATENDRIGDYVEVAAVDAYSVSGWLHIKIELDALVFERDENIEFRLYVWREGNASARDERWMEFDNVCLYGISDASGVSNFPPEINTELKDLTALYGSSIAPVAFVVSDIESAKQNLVVTVESDNEDVMPAASIAITQPNASGNASILPVPIAGGIANITVKVTDEGGESVSKTFKLTVNIVVQASGDGVGNDLFEGYFAGEDLPVPAPRLGWLFAGWYAFSNFSGGPVTSVNVSCTLYAKWDATITVLAEGKAIPQNFFAGYVPGEKLPVPVRSGFHFDGWYLSEDFSGDPVTSVTGSCTLYGHWLQIVLTPFISYPFDDGTFDPVIGEHAAGKILATEISNVNVDFLIFTDENDPHGENGGKWIQDHGQGPTHINAQTEVEATNPGGSNQTNDYIQFMLEPALVGDSIQLAQLRFDIQARTGDPSSPPELSYSASVYSNKPRPGITNIWTDPRNRLGEIATVSSNGLNSVSGWTTITCDLSHVKPAKDEIVEFRIYFWRTGITNQRGERWVEIDNVILYGALLQEEDPNAIQSVKQQTSVSFYPNPAKESIVINGLKGGETISFIGLDGRVWKNTTAAKDKENISLNGLSKGTYLIRIAGEQGAQTLKLIVGN